MTAEAGPAPFTQAAYDAACAEWLAARDDLDKVHELARAAERRLYDAEDLLAAQEAYPGIAAYLHAGVPATHCRIGHFCKIHGTGGQDR